MINGERPRWHARAACALSNEVTLDDFYAIHPDVVKLGRVCNACPVIAECYEWANDETYGFFANETAAERSLRRRGLREQPSGRKALP